MCGLDTRQDGRNRGTGSHHPTPPSAAALPQTGWFPPPQHGKAAPRVGVRACRAFIHHTISRHDTGGQDRAGTEPVIRAGGALHVTLAWAGERKQEDKVNVALPKTPRVSPQAGHSHVDRGRIHGGAGVESATSTP